MMKSLGVFLLVFGLVTTGIPRYAWPETGPKPLLLEEKAAFRSLGNQDLLAQKAGNWTWVDKKEEARLAKTRSDVGSTAAVLVSGGAALVVLFCSLFGNVNFGGGGC